MTASPAELQAIREHVAVFAKHIASPYHDTPESEYVAVELLSLLDAQADEVRRLREALVTSRKVLVVACGEKAPFVRVALDVIDAALGSQP